MWHLFTHTNSISGENLACRVSDNRGNRSIASMATYQCAAPTQFDFTNPFSWPKWLKYFERFRTASKLDMDTEEHQIGSLIYTMGEQAEEIFNSFDMRAADAKADVKLRERFTNQFAVKHNVIFERSKFNRRVQGPN